MSRLTGLLLLLCAAGAASAQEEAPRLRLGPGATGVLREVVLPGPELTVAPLDPDAPLVLRITSVSPHGTAHRYDFELYGLDPGVYDLSDLLVRKADGQHPADLPPLQVEVVQVLPPGQVQPLPLPASPLPRLGGYRLALGLGAAVWTLGLLVLLLGWRRRRAPGRMEEQEPVTLAARLRPLVDAARRRALDPEGQARLERLLLAAWRRRLELEHLPAPEAWRRLRAHPEAGALLAQLEAWLHQPPGRAEDVDLDALLAPYARLNASDEEAFA